MKRRDVLKTLAIASGGLVALPAWAMGWNSSDIADTSAIFSTNEISLLTALADTIIPEGSNAPGALTVGVETFLVKLIEECYEPDVHANVKAQLSALNKLARLESGTDFKSISRDKKEKLVSSFETSDDPHQTSFFNLIKSETIRGYRTSQVVMEQYLNYQLMPGYYDGCVDVKS